MIISLIVVRYFMMVLYEALFISPLSFNLLQLLQTKFIRCGCRHRFRTRIMNQHPALANRERVIAFDCQIDNRQARDELLGDAHHVLLRAPAVDEYVSRAEVVGVDPAARERVPFVFVRLQFLTNRAVVELATAQNPNRVIEGGPNRVALGLDRDQRVFVDVLVDFLDVAKQSKTALAADVKLNRLHNIAQLMN